MSTAVPRAKVLLSTPELTAFDFTALTRKVTLPRIEPAFHDARAGAFTRVTDTQLAPPSVE